MFTGLVQTQGTIVTAEAREQSRVFTIQCDLDAAHLALGASVCTSGVCLTVTGLQGDTFTTEAAFETLRLTTLGDLAAGDRVNLEPSLRVGDPLGGHLVSGHVDGVGKVASIEARGEAREYWFEAPEDLLPFIAVKGSICVDGVSLTVNAVEENRFMIGVIPHTLEVTTLGARAEGAPVNLEIDQLARYVARIIESRVDARST